MARHHDARGQIHAPPLAALHHAVGCDSRAVSGFSQKMALTPAWAAATTAPALAPTGSTGMAILIDSRANISL